MSLADLPAVNACLNGISAIFLGAGYYFIRRKNRIAHRNCMIAAFVASTIFLACYLTYHGYLAYYLHQGPTVFRKPPGFRPIYLRFDQHKKIARWTWPCWMYVSVTGVLIYLLLYQIFPQK